MRIRLLIAMAAAVSCTLAGSLVASALRGSADAAAPTVRHCVRDASGASLGCFDSYTTAIAVATNGTIDDAPADAAQAMRSERFQAEVETLASARGSTTVGGGTTAAVRPASLEIEQATLAENAPVIGATLFSGLGYTGNSETVMISKPCQKDGRYDYTYAPTLVTRSARSVQPWANCWIWLHDGDTTDSARQGPYKDDTPDLGDWNDRTVLVGLS
jgi:hypothetical protein